MMSQVQMRVQGIEHTILVCQLHELGLQVGMCAVVGEGSHCNLTHPFTLFYSLPTPTNPPIPQVPFYFDVFLLCFWVLCCDSLVYPRQVRGHGYGAIHWNMKTSLLLQQPLSSFSALDMAGPLLYDWIFTISVLQTIVIVHKHHKPTFHNCLPIAWLFLRCSLGPEKGGVSVPINTEHSPVSWS